MEALSEQGSGRYASTSSLRLYVVSSAPSSSAIPSSLKHFPQEIIKSILLHLWSFPSLTPHHHPGRLSATPWNRPAAPGRPAGARPQRGPRVNLLYWRANWRLSLRGRFWLRSWGNQIESTPGYSVPPSIEMDVDVSLPQDRSRLSRPWRAPAGPHVLCNSTCLVGLGPRLCDLKTSRRFARPQDHWQDRENVQDIKTTGDVQGIKTGPPPTCIKTDLDLCLRRQDGWSSSGTVVGHQ
ncbi:hypothetical protein GGG16DRAFT_108510 [Schizophyllum commune]